MTPPAWADIAADLDAALNQAALAQARARGLAGRTGDDRSAHELAIGKHLHDAYTAAEKAVERVVEVVDGDIPRGRSFHRDLIRRAAMPIPGGRLAIISADTAAGLEDLLGFRHVFRHVYGTFDFGRAAPNVALAATVIPRLRDEITAFAAGLGLAPRA
ncbi:hypothetical protein DFH01_03905 [Falsiroseomonas bella]|uniref:HepT-like domain-containing protein n=1 Tax=Falsiroseomonas bella TaxID=2184016 RepID=A0A317FLH7_9PROT|nr:hypothetical protein [Falsiroseomonas bella]PWS38436.1 hypothetical protein DFH01_03905 [Falsiroseomonas bella]